jgi:hypothetical protein
VAAGSPLLEQLMPAHDFGERHERTIAADPGQVGAAIRAVTPDDVPMARLLMTLRGISRRTGPSDRPFLEGMTEIGFAELGDGGPEELVFGGIGQPWRLSGGETVAVGGASSFSGFDRPGFVKMAMDFRLRQTFEGTSLQTRTWVKATDPDSRRRFRLYWLAVRFGSGIIRRSLLGAIARRAEGAGADG